MQSDRRYFEVRCPHCEVTFPVGTKICVHCGGATVASQDAESMGESPSPIFDFESSMETSDDASFNGSLGGVTKPSERSNPARNYGADSGFGSASRFEAKPDPGLEKDPPVRQIVIEEDGSEMQGLGRSILGSMGSLIWIVMLILFSLSGRVCGE